jgi:hypothetical protein
MFTAISLATANPGAAAESYMSLVGELVGAVEGLRMLRDHCAGAVPEMAVQNARAYEAWVSRNAALLALAKTQRDHADVRIARQAAGNASAPKSTTEIVALFQERLSAQLQRSGTEAQRAMCANYPKLISSSEKRRSEEIEALLNAVTEADRALSRRGE